MQRECAAACVSRLSALGVGLLLKPLAARAPRRLVRCVRGLAVGGPSAAATAALWQVAGQLAHLGGPYLFGYLSSGSREQTCVCHFQGTVEVEVLRLLERQLERCGPEHLAGQAPFGAALLVLVGLVGFLAGLSCAACVLRCPERLEGPCARRVARCSASVGPPDAFAGGPAARAAGPRLLRPAAAAPALAREAATWQGD